jgi:UDP-N-acetylmuramoyl-L-alanyl-D-glutamate--2,6-diaminopimelate ligase
MGVIQKLTTKVQAHAAAVSHRWPAKGIELILVGGADGSQATITALSRILRKQGVKVGVISSGFVEIAGERADGSDQADVLGDPFRMQALFAQMKRAGCKVVILEMPTYLPEHGFAGLQPTLAIMRRCGDSHLNEAHNAARKAHWRKVVGMRPKFIVLNRDDPCYTAATGMAETSIMTFGVHEKAECRITNVEIHPKGSATKLLVDHQTEINLATVLAGKTSIYSVVAAAAAAYLLHVPITSIEDGVFDLPPVPGAMQYVPAQRPYQLVIDSNSTPDGIAETLETVKHFTKNRLIAVVGANLAQPAEWRPLVGELAATFADRVVITDGEYTAEESATQVRQQLLQGVVNAGADARTEEVADRDAALEKAMSIARRGDTIVVLASTQRPYRQIGQERQAWSDAVKIEELLG